MSNPPTKDPEVYKPVPEGKPGPHDVGIKRLIDSLMSTCEKRITRGDVTIQEAANACGSVAYSLRFLDAKTKKENDG
jgi:hypothetical protein